MISSTEAPATLKKAEEDYARTLEENRRLRKELKEARQRLEELLKR